MTFELVQDQLLLDKLATLSPTKWSGRVYRCMLAGVPPERENNRGARWNPQNVPAIYTSLSAQGAIAEVEYRLSLEPDLPRKQIKKTIYEINVSLGNAINILADDFFRHLGITPMSLEDLDYSECQRIGAHIDWLEFEGAIVPSARHRDGNLVIFPSNLDTEYRFEVISKKDL